MSPVPADPRAEFPEFGRTIRRLILLRRYMKRVLRARRGPWRLIWDDRGHAHYEQRWKKPGTGRPQ